MAVTSAARKTNTWNKPKGKGPLGLDWAGCYPCTIIPFKDKTCREVDEDAFRILVRGILEEDIAGLDPNEAEGLSREETIRLMQIAKEEAKGRIPVSGKVEARNASWTWDSIEEAKRVIDAGADFLYFHPMAGPAGFDDYEDFINLYKTFSKAVKFPIVGTVVGVPPPVIKKIALGAEYLAAFKFEERENIGLMKELVFNMQEVEAETGRHVCPLRAGDQDLAECLVNGAEGNFNGGGSWRAKFDVAIYKAVKKGDLNEAFAIQKKVQPATDAVRGRYGAKIMPYGRFPYRYKIVCWLLGKIPNPYSRLPRVAFSNEEVLMIRDALIKSGLKVVKEPKECKDLGVSDY